MSLEVLLLFFFRGIIFAILLLLWWASRVTQEQEKDIKSYKPTVEGFVVDSENNLSKPESNLPVSGSKSITDAETEKQSIALPDKFPFNDNDFLHAPRITNQPRRNSNIEHERNYPNRIGRF